MTEEPRSGPLENADHERIAQRSADIVEDRVALRIGRGVLRMAVYLFVVAAIAAWTWLTAREYIR